MSARVRFPNYLGTRDVWQPKPSASLLCANACSLSSVPRDISASIQTVTSAFARPSLLGSLVLRAQWQPHKWLDCVAKISIPTDFLIPFLFAEKPSQPATGRHSLPFVSPTLFLVIQTLAHSRRKSVDSSSLCAYPRRTHTYASRTHTANASLSSSYAAEETHGAGADAGAAGNEKSSVSNFVVAAAVRLSRISRVLVVKNELEMEPKRSRKKEPRRWIKCVPNSLLYKNRFVGNSEFHIDEHDDDEHNLPPIFFFCVFHPCLYWCVPCLFAHVTGNAHMCCAPSSLITWIFTGEFLHSLEMRCQIVELSISHQSFEADVDFGVVVNVLGMHWFFVLAFLFTNWVFQSKKACHMPNKRDECKISIWSGR